jgi:putative ATP-dependent endonuclease of the OLD family
MYLKSLKIKNFRKFGDKNNVVEFVGSKNISPKSKNIDIAPSTTLIVGKNNSGKTTIAEALKRLLIGNGKFKANDFNFIYLSTLLDEYRNDKFEHFPNLEFEVTIGIDFNSDCDLVTNIAPFMSIESIQSAGKETDFRVVLRYELQETTNFKKDIQVLLCKQKDESVLFRKFLELINSTDFNLNFYNSEGVLIGENKFKVSDLLEIKPINANKIISDKSLSETFNRIIKFRYKSQDKPDDQAALASKIDEINKTITTNISERHTSSINTALSKIESSDRLEVNLRPDLTFEQILTNVIKYEYKEGKFHIPESQFGLGYSNLMTIIGELIEYIEKYPKEECHSKINLICIEEPEAFMHSHMQELFIKHINDAISYLLKDKEKEINSQLIITTHSSHILNSKIHEGKSFDNISYITIVDNFSNVVNLNDRNVIEDKPASDVSKEVETDDDKKTKIKKLADELKNLKFLKKHIKYKVSELFFSDAVIFVEGVTEETLLSYYIDQNEELNRYYISVFNINGAHGLVYHPLIKLLKVPSLIITDLDIKRSDDEKNNYTQIADLTGRATTNKTISKYNPDNAKIDGLKGYFIDENIYVVFQREAIEGYYATSFEEAFILSNYRNDILNKALSNVKNSVYKEVIGDAKDIEKLKKSSYKLQSNLSNSKSDFSNTILFEIAVSDDAGAIPELPKYINDGLKWLACSVKKQVRGGQ